MLSDSKREKCLEAAKECVAQSRVSVYGGPENNFARIAAVWNAQGYGKALKGTDGFVELMPEDVALMMAGMKLARLADNASHSDSWVDLAGYAACGYEVATDETL